MALPHGYDRTLWTAGRTRRPYYPVASYDQSPGVLETLNDMLSGLDAPAAPLDQPR